MNKKYIGIIGIAILIVLLVISSSITADKDSKKLLNNEEDIYENAQKESEKITKNQEKQKDFIEIGVDKYLEYYNGNEYKIVLFAHPSCEYCEVASPIIHKIAYEYDLDIYYLNIANFTSEDAENLTNSNEFFDDAGTPSLLVVGDGKLKDTINGLTDYEHYKNFLKKNKFIK